ncbi:16S rRNA (adenine(1518)-N(6)/adenine(1519)-N(6))-dimethyltransferase RsmA [Candidatus Palibaumannia cicadellinicola]|uniref:Ribosomal RNA small subunit methyltransferase A n=1 Tax=Baumannia cicadellinicola subsp. Homalodisca coagulata TaxID=374463 RepID=RSMA_BAUCH|nr:16S rRNA (adenine(1518)-N(6)/adenine(1519)-N(6))-dimethyltransferase RsmA [Candidatus Baumannia cicadellinicola]Q1LSS2.1 RecName: Full=Ribosomal RNA small subunit methyltransferase A; AltName: Full=16S rRNA (adenine(1518)-N(6)/adenine(1519)-N(6))-dimethyltransferase; AltName: Full=16S rRNA dimethyladenosine transferase; AltName: Full=16S rRNA dimethylase; AltName: Full=S-adenosylmethionine-6-N', N'-adenosyl(rRNA) dimethyltransferase [Baumannia cicadellinicola str. Hc (Homalodisca coagulata)]AB
MYNYFYQGHLVRKCLGQHFLHDQNIIESIVAVIHPLPSQALVEIGPGLGALTKYVAKYVKTITVIELDHNLVAYLANHPILQHKLNILSQDVMKVNFSDLAKKLSQPLRIFGNLPYNISIALMFNLFRHIHMIRDMHFMLQKEVVSRLLAKPNNKNYGKLSVIAQHYCQIDLVLDVPPESFRPVPQVDSAVVRLVPYVIPPYPVKDINKLYLLTSLAFQQRRKTIRNSLRNLFSVEQLLTQGIISTLRAENLSVEQYCCLASTLAECLPKK